MRLRRVKQPFNNYGTLAKTTMKFLTGVAPAGRSQSFGSLKRVDEVNNLEPPFNNYTLVHIAPWVAAATAVVLS